MIDAVEVYARLWVHFALNGGTPARGHDGRITPNHDPGNEVFPADGTACALFLTPGDHSGLIGMPISQWAMAARRCTAMDGNAYQLLLEAEGAVREVVKESLIEGGILSGALFTPRMAVRLEAIRVDFRLPPYAPPVPKRTI